MDERDRAAQEAAEKADQSNQTDQVVRSIHNPAPEQDLHVAIPSIPDSVWARTQPLQLEPSEARLKMASQTVTLFNSHPSQTHVVVDRFLVGHEMLPGQRIHNVEMLAEDIDYFLRQRSRRLDNRGFVKPLHPIIIESVPAARDSDFRDEGSNLKGGAHGRPGTKQR